MNAKLYFNFVIFLILVSCDKQLDIKYKSDITCFNHLEKQIMSKKRENLNFDKVLDCFDWDTLRVIHLNEKELKKYYNFKFKVINDKIRKRLVDDGKIETNQEQWSYIIFYKNGNLQDDILAIHDNDLVLTTFNIYDKIDRKDAVFSIGFKENTMTEMHFKDTLLYSKYRITD